MHATYAGPRASCGDRDSVRCPFGERGTAPGPGGGSVTRAPAVAGPQGTRLRRPLRGPWTPTTTSTAAPSPPPGWGEGRARDGRRAHHDDGPSLRPQGHPQGPQERPTARRRAGPRSPRTRCDPAHRPPPTRDGAPATPRPAAWQPQSRPCAEGAAPTATTTAWRSPHARVQATGRAVAPPQAVEPRDPRPGAAGRAAPRLTGRYVLTQHSAAASGSGAVSR